MKELNLKKILERAYERKVQLNQDLDNFNYTINPFNGETNLEDLMLLKASRAAIDEIITLLENS